MPDEYVTIEYPLVVFLETFGLLGEHTQRREYLRRVFLYLEHI
jgi:hypothetical protein